MEPLKFFPGKLPNFPLLLRMDTNEVTKYTKRFASILGDGLEHVLILVILVERGQVPWWGWPVLTAAIAYFLNPLDALPDPIFLDDLGVLAAALATLQSAITEDVRQEARRRVRGILGK